jgi:tetratricopeptide (TPR) repeat protein
MMRWLAIALVIVAVGRTSRAQPSPSPDAPDAGSDKADSTTDPTSPKANAAERYKAGQYKFDAGEFLDAASEFEAAYALDPDPVYLYNTAQAYRRGSACARAADYYRRFLAVIANPPNLDKVRHYLSELDACAKAESVEEPTPHEIVPVQPATVVMTSAAPPTAEGDRRIGIPLAVASAGVVALAVGGLLTHDVGTLETYSQALCAQGMTCQWDASKQARADSLQSRGNRDSAISISAYGVGGAAIVTAALLYMFGPREPVAITPIASGAAITGSVAF